MIPFDVTLAPATRTGLLVLIEVIFWIYVPVSFICVARYAAKQFQTGQLINGKNAPLPFTSSGPMGWLFILCVLGLVFLQSPLYFVVMLAGVVGLLIENGRSTEEQFGLARLGLVRTLSWSLLVFGAIMLIEAPLTEGIAWLLKTVHMPNQEQETVETFRHIDQPVEILKFILVAAFVSPIFEELFFRGYLITFLKKYTSTWAALVLSAGVFAFAHPLNLGAVLPLWFLGLVLGIAYEHTGSLLLPIGIHACWNLVTALSLLLDKGNAS